MNPFTRFLRQWSRDRKLEELVAHCDALERLVIRVYKGGEATPADEAEYEKIRTWMQANYGAWQDALRPYWQEAKVAGHPAGEDPFRHLLAAEQAAAFVDNWTAMQHLPAAREALNKLVINQGEDE